MLSELLDKAWEVRGEDPVEAEKLYSQCLALDPLNPEALRELGILTSTYKEDHEKALSYVTTSMEVEDNTAADLYFIIILNRLNAQLQSKIESHFERSVKKVEGVPKGLLEDEYARYLAGSGRYMEALKYQKSAAGNCPDQSYIQDHLSYLEKYVADNEVEVPD